MSEINLKGELRKGYLLFRAFENAMKLADEVETLDATIAAKKKIIENLDKDTIAFHSEFVEQKKKFDDLIKKEETEVEQKKKQISVDYTEYKKTFDDKYKPLTDKIAKAEAREKQLNASVLELEEKLNTTTKAFNELNKNIEDTKAKLRSMM